jgi:D-alanyl-lipoteichoic acid acyltransferase DltB (MBOAT superfamily)
LGGSRGSLAKKIRNVFIIFIVSGFWHGANWTFIIWGALNAIYFLPLLLTNKNRQHIEVVAKDKWFPTIKELFSMLLTFGLTVVAWIFFRAASVKDALNYIKEIFINTQGKDPYYIELEHMYMAAGIILFVLFEWVGRENKFALEKFALKKPKVLRYVFYYVLILLIILLAGKEQAFIYFQF